MQYLLSDDFFSQRIHNVQQFPFFMQIGRSKEEKVSRSTNCSTATALWILAVMKTVQIFEFSVNVWLIVTQMTRQRGSVFSRIILMKLREIHKSLGVSLWNWILINSMIIDINILWSPKFSILSTRDILFHNMRWGKKFS